MTVITVGENTYVYGENQYVFANTNITESTPKNKSNATAFHFVQEGSARN